MEPHSAWSEWIEVDLFNKKENVMKYESPSLIPLGSNESAAGEPEACLSGTSAVGGACNTGSAYGTDVCAAGGAAATGNCRSGGTAWDCIDGSSARN